MKPSKAILTAEQYASAEYALRKAIFYAEMWINSQGGVGDKEILEQIRNGLKALWDAETTSCFEDEDERNAAFLENFAEECRQHGCD